MEKMFKQKKTLAVVYIITILQFIRPSKQNMPVWSNLEFNDFLPEYIILGRYCQWEKYSTLDFTISRRKDEICIFERHQQNLVFNLGIKTKMAVLADFLHISGFFNEYSILG